MTLAELKYLKAYRVLPQEGIEPILNEFLVNTSKYIRGATITSPGQCPGLLEASLSSEPQKSPEDWPSFFHPIYGTCFEFSPSQNPMEFMSTSGIGFVKFTANFMEAFPHFEPRKALNQSTIQEIQKEQQNRLGENQLLIVTFEKGSFLTSQQVSVLKRGENSQLTLSQDILDKTKTQRIFECQEYETETEDECLNDCLVKTFVQEFGCLHPRLKLMKLKNETYKNQKTCVLQDLEPKTAEYSKKLASKKAVEEFGLVRIKQILASFKQDHDEKTRCGCPIKCKKSIFSIGMWLTKIQEFRGRKSHINYMTFRVSQLYLNITYFFNDFFSVSALCQGVFLPFTLQWA